MRLQHRRRSERGTVIVMAVVVMTVVLGFIALSVDMGMLMTAQSELQNAADAAAFAGVGRLISADYYGAVEQAWSFATANSCLGQNLALGCGDIQLGIYDFDQHTFTAAPWGSLGGSNAVRVYARRTEDSAQGSLPLAFARILGRNMADVEASTIAVVDRRVSGFDGSVAGIMLPFAISEDKVGNPPVVGYTFELYPNKTEEDGLLAAGNFGLLDLDDSNPGTSTLGDWIIDGFPGAIEIPADGNLPMGGAPGLATALSKAVEERIGEVVVVFVHNAVSEGGENTVYNVVSLVAVEVVSVSGGGTNLSFTVRVAELPSSGFIVRPGAPWNASVGKIGLVQ